MREFVGVKSYLDCALSRSLKRDALIFNYIVVPDINEHTSPRSDLPDDVKSSLLLAPPQIFTELNYLHEEGVVRDIDESTLSQQISDDEYEDVLAHETAARELAMQIDTQPGDIMLDLDIFFKDPERKIEFPKMAGFLILAEAYRARRLSIQLRSLSEVDAYPISALNSFAASAQQGVKGNVVHIVFNALPIPDESVPWEQVIEYRSDPDSRSNFLALRYWMSEVARAELTPTEVEEKLEYLIDQYRKHMRLHRMKTNVGTLETIVTTGAEFLGDLVSFKWGKAAEALFSLKRRRLALLEGELTAPGNEVAYIVKARETLT